MEKLKTTQGVIVNFKQDTQNFIKFKHTLMTEKYSDLLSEIESKLEQLTALEEIIIQERCLDSDLKIKLSFLREYVYARCPFFRKDKSTKDIRVLVSRTDLIDPNNPTPTINDLYLNKEFMTKVNGMLVDAMIKELNKSTLNYFKLYDNT